VKAVYGSNQFTYTFISPFGDIVKRTLENKAFCAVAMVIENDDNRIEAEA